jgi:tetratricopeptide (TPR) repeat protein
VPELQPGTVFVGRDRELLELLDGLEQAASGRGRLMLLSGEPGIGKSRLADELASRARSRGYRVLWGRGWEDAGAPAYWPWVQALRAYLRSIEPDRLRHELGPGAADVAQMLPELRTLFPELSRPPDTDPESARFRLFDSTVTFLRNAATDHPLVIVIDDLQSADTASALLLRFLTTQLADMAVLIVGTYRDVELTPDHPLTAAIAELGREPVTRTLAIRGLEQEAVGRFIGAAINAAPKDHLVSAVWRETNGNPLFVGEAVRLLSAEGRLNDVSDLLSLRVAVPAGIRAVIARRISRLSAASAEALRLGAALGPEFSVETLRRVGGYDGEGSMALLLEAAEAGLLVPVAGAFGRYRFSHDLVRETLDDDLSPGPRARLHRRIADVLEGQYAGSLESHYAELAFHFLEAARADPGADRGDVARDARRAVAYSHRAGDAATASLAYEEAARHYRTALAVLALDQEARERTRAELLLALGGVQTRAGDLDDARSTFLEAADLARRLGEARLLAEAALGYGGRYPWARPGRDTRLIPLLQDALVMLGGSDEPLRVLLLSRLSCAWRSTPERSDDSAALSLQAVDLARRIGDAATLGYALAAHFWATWRPENPEVRPPIAREMAEVAEAVGDGERLAASHLMLFITHSELGHIGDAARETEALRRVIEEMRQPAQLWLTSGPPILLALLQGEFELAETIMQADATTRHPVGPARDEVSVRSMQRFLLRRAQGRGAEEEEPVRSAARELLWYPLHRAALVCLLAEAGRETEARHEFHELARDGFAVFNRDNEWLLGMCLAADACALLGERGEAAVLHELLAPFTGRLAIGHLEGSVGVVDRYVGLLAATMGRLTPAAAHLADAVRLNEELGARPWTAYSQRDLAAVLRRRDEPGDRAEAEVLERAALRTATSTGMALADELRARLASDAEKTDAAMGLPTDVLAAPPADPGTPSGPRSVPPFTPGSAVFRRDGEYWTIRFERDAFTIRDARGMRHLATLLASPGREIHALDLAAGDPGAGSGRSGTMEAIRLDPMTGSGPVIDAAAKAAYRSRIQELRADMAEAESWNDPVRAARAESELESLTHELATAMGLRGRDRPAGSAAERARVSVTRAIRSSLTRIESQSAALGAHFAATVRTGTYCSYVPDPRVPTAWELAEPVPGRDAGPVRR